MYDIHRGSCSFTICSSSPSSFGPGAVCFVAYKTEKGK